MSILVAKLIVCPIALVISWFIFPIDFAVWYQPVILGVILAVIGRGMEKLMLREETKTLSLLADLLISALIVYFVTPLFAGAEVTFWGAILTALLLGITEIPQHRAIIRKEKQAIPA